MLAWLTNLSAQMFTFRATAVKLKTERDAIGNQLPAVLRQHTEIDWLTSDTRMRAEASLANEMGQASAAQLEAEWVNAAAEILGQIEPAKRRVSNRLNTC